MTNRAVIAFLWFLTLMPLVMFAAVIVALIWLFSSPVHAEPSSFGAIAYNRTTGEAATAKGWPDSKTALHEATTRCGPHCQPIMWFYDGCGALAVHGNIVAYGYGGSEKIARTKALSQCEDQTETECRVKLVDCTW